jgi:CRP/FNR family cyclic AMP-dependent transcriptional regulator
MAQQSALKPYFSDAWRNLPRQIACELLAHAASRSVHTGETLFEFGTPCDGCYRLDDGLLKVSLHSLRGEERILTIVPEGSMVGALDMIDGLSRSETVTALVTSGLSFISRASFEECAKRHPEIYQCLLRALGERLRETENDIAALTFLNAKGRVAHALLKIAASLSGSSENVFIPRVIHQKELAALAWVARENTNKILKDWEQRNLLSKSSASYCISDKKRLQRETES